MLGRRTHITDPNSRYRQLNLSNATNLTQAQIDGTLGDSRTRLPSGLSVPPAWKITGH